MLKVLLKKQFTEVFKGYFYDAKHNRMRSKAAIAAWFTFFVVVIGVLAGVFAGFSLSLCGGLARAGAGWLYFAIMGGCAILFGTFGAVFSSYASLFLARDNDLLFSLPISVRDILVSRLASVYLLGTMYASVVLVPALIVYWVVVGVNAAVAVCGIGLLVIVSLFVLCLSCLLGWVIAKISLKLKNKSLVTVLITLVFIGLYYFVYCQASDIIKELLVNAALFGVPVEGAAYGLYAFGCIGEGNLLATGAFLAIAAALLVLTWWSMSRNYLQTVTATGKVKSARYVEKTAKQQSQFWALVGKEFAKFTSSPNYMLNTGLGILFLLVAGVAVLLNADLLNEVVGQVWGGNPSDACVLFCGALCLMAASNDMVAPSVSLEGKSIYLLQSLPLTPRCVLRAKAAMQFILTAVPLAFAATCVAAVVDLPLVPKALMCFVPFTYEALITMASSWLGVKMANLDWTNEIMPIKQGGAVTISLFGGWGVAALFVGLYFAVGSAIGATTYLAICAALFMAAATWLFYWLSTEGSRIFATL